MTKIKKKLTFFRHVELPKQTAPPRRSVPARSGASRGDPELNVGALPKPIHTRVSMTGGSRSPQLPQTNY